MKDQIYIHVEGCPGPVAVRDAPLWAVILIAESTDDEIAPCVQESEGETIDGIRQRALIELEIRRLGL